MNVFEFVLRRLRYTPHNIFVDSLYDPITDEGLEGEWYMFTLYKGYTRCNCNKEYTTFVRFSKKLDRSAHTTAVVCSDCLHHLSDVLLYYKEVPFNFHKKQYPGASPMFDRRAFVRVKSV